MSTVATDKINTIPSKFSADGSISFIGLTKREWCAAKILEGLLTDNLIVAAFGSDAAMAAEAVRRADALLDVLDGDGSELVDPPDVLKNGNSPQLGLTKEEFFGAHILGAFGGNKTAADALDSAPSTPVDALAGLGAGNVEHITVPASAPTVALQSPAAAGNVNLITVPIAPTAALAGAGAGNVDHCIVPIAPTAVMAGAAGNIDNIPAPTAPTMAMSGATPGSVDSIDAPAAATVGLAGAGAGSVDDVTVPIAPTSVLAGAGAGNVDSVTVPIAPTAALAGAGAGNVDHITVPIAPTMVEGAAGLVDVGDHWYLVTYTTADGETTMGAISAAAITIAGAAKHVTVTIPVSPFVGVTGRNIYRTKIAGGHVARTDFFLVGSVANNTDVSYDDNLAEAGMPATNPPAASTAASYKYVVTYTTADGESTMGAVQAVSTVVADNTADGKVTVTIPVSAQSGVSGRKVYRCKAGTGSTSTLRTHFFLVATVANNVDVTCTDNVAESGVGANPPAANNGAQYKYLVTYTTASGGETTIGAIQAAATTVADKTADGQVTVTIPVSSQGGVTGRKVYRSKLGLGKAVRTDFFLAATVANNADVSVVDNVAESGLGANPPAASNAGSHKYVITLVTNDGETTMGSISAAVVVADKSADGKVALSVIPTSAFAGVISRKIYRSKAGTDPSLRTHFFLVDTIADNVTATYEDNIADSALGASPPAANNAAQYEYLCTYTTADGETTMGAISAATATVADKSVDGKVTVTIPVSSYAGVTGRKVYRSHAGCASTSSVRTDYHLVATVANNTDVSVLDNVDEATAAAAANPPAANSAAGYKYVVTYTTADGETTLGAIQAVKITVADKSADGQATVTIPVSAQANVTGRKVYRTKAGTAATAASRTDFFLVATVANNVDVSVTDNVAESGVGANPPASNTGYKYKYIVTYVGEDTTETTMGAVQAAGVASTDKTADGKVTVTIPVSAEGGVGSRNIYRCAGGLAASAASRTHFFKVGTVANNTDVTFTDDVSEATRATGANPPAANGTGGHKYVVTFETADGETTMGSISSAVTIADPSVNGRVKLTAIPVSTQAGVTKRTIYRSKAGAAPTLRTHFFKVGTISDNTTLIYEDNVADSGLGASPPATNNAGNYTYKITNLNIIGESEPGSASGGVYVSDKASNGKVALSNILAGPAGTDARNIYRTKCGFGSTGPWYYLAQIADNATTTYTDNTADSGLDTTKQPGSTDVSWGYNLSEDVYDKVAKMATALAMTVSDEAKPSVPYISSAGVETWKGMTKKEFFALLAQCGFITDNTNLGAHSNAQLATHAVDRATALINALNA